MLVESAAPGLVNSRICAVAGLLCALMSSPALAQNSEPGPVSPQGQDGAPVLADEAKPAVSNPYARFDALSLKGWDTPYPKIADTILQDKGGIRTALADAGFGAIIINSNNIVYDVSQTTGNYKGRQLFNGQKLTMTSALWGLAITYDLGRLGLAGGQISTSFGGTWNTFQRNNGPRKQRVQWVHYYQELWNGKATIKIGYLNNTQEFLGINVGGNLATGNLGPQATIPFQLGLSYSGFAAPGIIGRFNFKDHFYDKWGVQRSLPPGGATVENRLNPSGFRFAPPGTGVLFINEAGYNRRAAPGVRSLWIRGGGMFNTTNYSDFSGGMKKYNYAAYIAADHQLSQFDAGKPFRGIYVGATFEYAPPEQNIYSQYYEGRVYSFGLFKDRPFDLASLVVTYNAYSKTGVQARSVAGAGHYDDTLSAIASYAYRVGPGLYVQPGLGVTHHPIFSPRFGTAVNAYLGITTIF